MTIAQAYNALRTRAETERLRKQTELAGQLTPYQRAQIAQWEGTHVNVNGMAVPATDVFRELMSRRGERTVTVGDQTFTVSNEKALDLLLDNLSKRSVTIDGQEFKIPEEAAARLTSQRELARKRLGLAEAREERQKGTAELNAAAKRIGTILAKYGENVEGAEKPTDLFELIRTIGANRTTRYQELVRKARTGDREAKADLRAVARDMYAMRAPNGLLPKEYFEDSVIELLKTGTTTLANGKVVKLPKDGTVKLEDEDGVFIRVKLDPSGMVKIVEVIG